MTIERKPGTVPKHTPTHPKKMLLEEFLEPLHISQVEAAECMGVPCSGSTASATAFVA